MKKTAAGIKKSIQSFYSEYSAQDDDITSVNLSPDKWSLKQIIGHLIDSASNNHQRIVRLQISEAISFSDYDKDEWLAIGNYNQYNFRDLLDLLVHYNKLIAFLIGKIDESSFGNRWMIDGGNEKTLKEIALQYLEHLNIHIDQFIIRLGEIRKAER